MKKSLFFVCLAAALMLFVSCGSAKKVATEKAVETKDTIMETMALSGIDMGKTLSEDGTRIVERPFKWFLGTAALDNRQAALELAEYEARAVVSRTLSNAVKTTAARNNITVNEKVMHGAEMGWEQVGSAIASGCTPYGDAVVKFNKQTGIYTVSVKVAMRGDLYNKALENAVSGIKAPKDLTKEEAEKFIELNNLILSNVKAQ